jgi:enoyl-CoA hydratase/carnithine racemase
VKEGGRVGVEVHDGVAVLTLRNPPANFLSRAVAADLNDAIEGVRKSGARAVVVTGSGRTFSAGADPSDLQALRTARAARLSAAAGQRMLNRLEQSTSIVVAAINGLCLGGGLELAMACHLRFCSDRARLGLPEITLGLIPGLGGTQRLPALVGTSRALSLVLTGDTVAADQAKQIGLVDEVVAAADLMAEVMKFARRIAQRPPPAVAAALATLRIGGGATRANGLRVEADAFGRLCARSRAEERLRPLWPPGVQGDRGGDMTRAAPRPQPIEEVER